MSTESNVYSQGGGGTTYEFDVDTAFVVQFIIGGCVPGLDNGRIEMVRFQSGSLGYATDDLLLTCLNSDGDSIRMLLQVKHVLTISEKNAVFQDVLKSAWQDFTNSILFNQSLDKIYIVKSYLTADEKKHLKALCNWAKVKSSTEDFIKEANRIATKKNYLELFQKVLSSAKGTQVTNDELFAFFKCFDVLEFDFGEIVSNSKSSFLTIIEQAKHDSCTLLPIQIWNDVFAFVSHIDNKGGSFDRQNIPARLQTYFKPNFYAPVQQKLYQISKQSEEILDLIEDKIGGSYTLPRWDYLEKLYAELSTNSFIVVTGDPGTGKSAIAKQILKTSAKSQNSFLLVFRADELGKGNLRDYFTRFNISLSLAEIFQFFPLHSSHYIYIDALEKLTEDEGIAFKQLLTTITPFPHIKVIATCREAEFPLLRLKYFSALSIASIKVDALNDQELENVATELPVLSQVLQNTRLRVLLRSPKYLDLAFKAVQQSIANFTELNEQQFIQILWEVIIENKINANIEGLPVRRSNQFIEIAIARAKSMSPYIIPSTQDAHALTELQKDAVIARSKYQEAYAPSHDILEDWALIRHTNKIFHSNSTPKQFFSTLGKEPAMRRAYRLWTLQALKLSSAEHKLFFSQVLTDNSLESFWGDESIIALLYSPYLEEFLRTNTQTLQDQEWALFTKLIHIMRTACRELGELVETKEKKFLPIGDCWDHMFRFIATNIPFLPKKHYDLVLQTVNDWHFILYNKNVGVDITEAPGLIVKWLFENRCINADAYYYKNDNVIFCLKLIFDCGVSMGEDIKRMLSDALVKQHRDNVEDWKEAKYHEEIIELALSGLSSTQLANYAPYTLLKMMEEEWIYKPPVRKECEADRDWYFRNLGYSSDGNIPFGIASEFKREYFPASALQTPTYWLLKYHTAPTISFIIDLLNHATNSLIKSDYASSDEREAIILYLPNDKSVEQHGSKGLWCMFRGTGIATPYLLQSVLMALEKFLLEVASQGLDKKDELQGLIEQIITQSKTVALTAVVASVAQAYPTMIGKWIVPLFSHRSLLYWDIARAQGDHDPLNLRPLPEDQVFWQERHDSNKLPHRLKYDQGLKAFVIDYCFNIREYNKEIFALFDKLKKKARKDVIWKKTLWEIDIRNWQVTKTERVQDGVRFQVEPVYKGKLKEQVQKMQENSLIYFENTRKSNWLMQVKDGKAEPDLNKWKEIANDYKALDALNPMYHYIGVAASVGIRFFWSELEQDEKQWCYDQVTSIAMHVIKKEITHDYLTMDISPFDDDAVMEVLPLLLDKEEINPDGNMKLLAGVLFANVSYNSLWYNRFLVAFGEHAWKRTSEQSLRLWKALVAFAPLELNNPARQRRHYTEEEMKAHLAQENNLLKQLIENSLDVEVQSISLFEYSQWALRKAVKMLPSQNCPAMSIDFLLRLIDLFIGQQFPANDNDHSNYNDDDKEFNIQLKFELQEKLAQVILWDANSTGKTLFRDLMERFYNPNVLEAENKKAKGEVGKFIRSILEHIIYVTDKNLPDDNPEKQQNTVHCFKTIWEEYVKISIEKEIILFGDLLFLNIPWRDEARHWAPLESMGRFFEGLILLWGSSYIRAVVNLLSHIGDKSLLPKGLTALWQNIKITDQRQSVLSIPKLIQLVYRVYNYHLEELNKDLLARNSFMELLEQMVKEGSSDAYWIREYMISFRTTI